MAIPKSLILQYHKFSHSAKLKAFYVFSLLFLALDPSNNNQLLFHQSPLVQYLRLSSTFLTMITSPSSGKSS